MAFRRFITLVLWLGTMGHASASMLQKNATPGPQIGACKAAAKIRLASKSCANVWPDSHYPSWNDADLAPNQVKALAPLAPGQARPASNEFTVLSVNTDTRMVQIATGKKDAAGKEITGWVGSDALQCDNWNLSKYTAPVAFAANADVCLSGSSPMATMTTELMNLANDSHTPFSEAIKMRAAQYAVAVRKNYAADNALLAGAFMPWDVKGAPSKPLLDDDNKRYAALLKAQDRLRDLSGRARKVWGDNCDQTEELKRTTKLDEGTRERGERTCRTLRDSYNFLHKVLESGDQKTSMKEFQDGALVQLSLATPNNEALSVRMALFYALDLEGARARLLPAQIDVLAAIHLKRSDDWDLANGEQAKNIFPVGGPFTELHNGYVYGNSGKPGDSIDCTAFALQYVLGMSRTADPNGRGSVPAVPDFDNLHRYLSKEVPYAPMYYAEYAPCFKVVDLRKDEYPMRGDFVSSSGHVAIVNNYDPVNRRLMTLEAASGDLGTVGRGVRPLYEPACKGESPEQSHVWDLRPLRSDVRVMRFEPKPGCPILDVKQPKPDSYKDLDEGFAESL